MPSHAGPTSELQVRQELREIAFVFGEAGDPADRMNLAGAAAAPLNLDALHFTSRHAYLGRTGAEIVILDVERNRIGVQLGHPAAAGVQPREELWEIGTSRDPTVGLQFGRRDELDARFVNVLGQPLERK